MIRAMTCLTAPDTDYVGTSTPVTLEGVSSLALLDTGATINAISSRVFCQLPEAIRNTLKISGSVKFTSANGASSSSLGCIALTTRLLDSSVTMDFHVINDLVKPVIIGTP